MLNAFKNYDKAYTNATNQIKGVLTSNLPTTDTLII